jgi:hypothetical protein
VGGGERRGGEGILQFVQAGGGRRGGSRPAGARAAAAPAPRLGPAAQARPKLPPLARTVAASHTRMVASSEQLARKAPSGDHATSFTPSAWPSSVAAAAAGAPPSHSLTVLSALADATADPSGEKRSAVTAPEWASGTQASSLNGSAKLSPPSESSIVFPLPHPIVGNRRRVAAWQQHTPGAGSRTSPAPLPLAAERVAAAAPSSPPPSPSPSRPPPWRTGRPPR